MSEKNTEFMRWMRIQRATKGVTQKVASEQIGCHWRTWHLWETGKLVPTRPNLVKLSEWSNDETTAGELLDKTDKIAA